MDLRCARSILINVRNYGSMPISILFWRHNASPSVLCAPSYVLVHQLYIKPSRVLPACSSVSIFSLLNMVLNCSTGETFIKGLQHHEDSITQQSPWLQREREGEARPERTASSSDDDLGENGFKSVQSSNRKKMLAISISHQRLVTAYGSIGHNAPHTVGGLDSEYSQGITS